MIPLTRSRLLEFTEQATRFVTGTPMCLIHSGARHEPAIIKVEICYRQFTVSETSPELAYHWAVGFWVQNNVHYVTIDPEDPPSYTHYLFDANILTVVTQRDEDLTPAVLMFIPA